VTSNFTMHSAHWRDGAEAAARLMRDGSRPDVLLRLDDNMALGALRAVHESGVRVPGEVDVVGFDGIEAAAFRVPSLTSVSPDQREIARTAVSLPLNRIDGPDSGPPRRNVVRESSGGRGRRWGHRGAARDGRADGGVATVSYAAASGRRDACRVDGRRGRAAGVSDFRPVRPALDALPPGACHGVPSAVAVPAVVASSSWGSAACGIRRR
jgi:hypothetical protein